MGALRGPSTAPIDIVHDTVRGVLTITWDDETASEYPIPYLRGWCRCAGCQGHGNVARFQPAEGVTAARVDEVGSFALRFVFSDGHWTGIYTWDWLRRIAAESPPLGFKHGTFQAGQFSP